MIIRQFNASGIEQFRAFLAQCRAAPETPTPLHLLENNAHTQSVTPTVSVEPNQFANRREAAEYLHEVLKPLPDAEVLSNAGLWTWLTLFYFDEVCPAAKGKRAVTNDYSYIFEPKNSRHYYRHLLHIGWRVLHVAPTHHRLFLTAPVLSLDKVTTEVMKRLYLTRIPCIFEVLDRLYWDEVRGKARAGIVSPEVIKPGDLVHRFPIRMHQLEKTYDLVSLSAAQLIELLGDEFKYKPASAKAGRR